jgi:Macrocin-O-methyltransferase (TylF)
MRAVGKILDRIQEKKLSRLVQPYTLVSPERVQNLYRLARRIELENIPGDVVECGVCNGGTAAILASTATKSSLPRTVWLLDSFQGMPEVTAEDGDGAVGGSAQDYVGQVVGSVDRVRQILVRVGANMDRVKIIPGWFDVTFPAVNCGQIALLNIDADWYKSVKLCLETFYDRVVKGGFISFDDYGHWPGCRKAVDEFFSERGIAHPLNEVDYTARWLQK